VPAHRDLIVEQFTKQAVPFSTAPGIRDEEALRLLVEFAGAAPEDTVLDVACGPGLVVCAFAAVVRHATGIDVTPAMIERGRALPEPGGAERIRRSFLDSLDSDGLGLATQPRGDTIVFAYPVAALVATAR